MARPVHRPEPPAKPSRPHCLNRAPRKRNSPFRNGPRAFPCRKRSLPPRLHRRGREGNRARRLAAPRSKCPWRRRTNLPRGHDAGSSHPKHGATRRRRPVHERLAAEFLPWKARKDRFTRPKAARADIGPHGEVNQRYSTQGGTEQQGILAARKPLPCGHRDRPAVERLGHSPSGSCESDRR